MRLWSLFTFTCTLIHEESLTSLAGPEKSMKHGFEIGIFTSLSRLEWLSFSPTDSPPDRNAATFVIDFGSPLFELRIEKASEVVGL